LNLNNYAHKSLLRKIIIFSSLIFLQISGNSSHVIPTVIQDMNNPESYLSATPLDNNLSEQIAIEQNIAPTTTRVSVAADGTQASVSVTSEGTQASDDSYIGPDSYSSSISADGRYVAFQSYADNLVPGDTNEQPDIFVRDRQTGTTERVNVAADGTQANDYSYSSSISADGRYVAFLSRASNLVPGDTNEQPDIFVRDRQTGTTERVNVAADGTQANNYSGELSISADGRYLAFASRASNLVSDDTNEQPDIFVRDRQTGTTERVSVAADGTQANKDSWEKPTISADGRYVAFSSRASNLIPDDTNEQWDIFVRDRQTGTTERVSVAADGTQANNGSYSQSISADGRYVAFSSWANNLVPDDTNERPDIFVRDRQTGTTERVSVTSDGTQANSTSWYPSISADGSHVAFQSDANNLVPGDKNDLEDIFVRDLAGGEALRDRQTGTTEKVSVATDGTQANSISSSPSISADGSYVAFQSDASNLVPGDTNDASDIFVRDLAASFSPPEPSEHNIIKGTPEKDLLLGTPDSDLIYGLAGNDTLFGKDGNDSLFGGDGRDYLFSCSGDDILDGGASDDWLSGGSGADQFVLREGDGLNTIVDYLEGTDSFWLDGGLTFEKLTISQGSCGTVISVTETNEELAALIGVEANSIAAEDFTTLV
jgi:Tol biopolymer transport system component